MPALGVRRINAQRVPRCRARARCQDKGQNGPKRRSPRPSSPTASGDAKEQPSAASASLTPEELEELANGNEGDPYDAAFGSSVTADDAEEQPAAADDAKEPPAAASPSPTPRELLDELTNRANQGDPHAMIELRRMLDTHPEIWETIGNLATLAEQAWIDLIAGENRLVMESVQRQIRQMKSDLCGPSPTSLEKLLIDRVVGCWLAMQYAESASAHPGPLSLGQEAFWLKRAESAQRRYMNAVKMLTTLRALVPDPCSGNAADSASAESPADRPAPRSRSARSLRSRDAPHTLDHTAGSSAGPRAARSFPCAPADARSRGAADRAGPSADTPPTLRRRVRQNVEPIRSAALHSLGFATEGLLTQLAILGLQIAHLLFQLLDAFDGSGMVGTPVVCLPAEFDVLPLQPADLLAQLRHFRAQLTHQSQQLARGNRQHRHSSRVFHDNPALPKSLDSP